MSEVVIFRVAPIFHSTDVVQNLGIIRTVPISVLGGGGGGVTGWPLNLGFKGSVFKRSSKLR